MDFSGNDKNRKILNLLKDAKAMDSQGQLDNIFKKMGDKQIGFKDLIAFKADYQNSVRNELIAGGMDGKEAVTTATEKWNSEYQHIERRMIQQRQLLVKQVWKEAVTEYIKKNNTPVIKGDIGGWATEAFEKMRFESDIDFTLFFMKVEQAEQLRNLFESKIKKYFGLDMRQFDAFCTAQRKAAFDVYIGEWGAKWGEIDMARRGKAEVWVLEDGKLVKREISGKEALIMYHKKRRTYNDKIFEPTADMEPGISMELLRHLKAEIFQGKFSTLERMIKMSKYINRSTVDHKRLLGDFATTKNERLAIFARNVTEAKQNISDTDVMTRRIFDLLDNYLGESWADNPDESIKMLEARGEAEMRHNILEGIEYHKKRINNISDPDEKAKERKWLEDVLEKEKSAYDHDKLKFPDEAQKLLDKYKGIEKAKTFFGEKSVEFVKIMSKKTGGAKMAMAYLLNKAGNNIDMVNNFMDFLDNKTIENIRNSDIPIEIKYGETTLGSINIGAINEKLNDSILGKIGNNVGFKGFTLAEEVYSYYDAYAKASDNEEAFRNIAVEIFRRRVPGGGIVEAVAMENYTRACLETVYLIFPPLAIPEAVGSIAYQVGSVSFDYGKGEYWQSAIDELTENLYEESVFKPVPGSKGAKWRLTKLGYKGKKYDRANLKEFITTKDHDGWWFDNWIGTVLTRAVENDPVLKSYEELMAEPLVGETWRNKIQQKWDERNDEVRLAFLEKLIASIEDRWAAFMLGQGIGADKLKEIRAALQCGTKPLVPETGEAEVDGQLYRQVMINYETHVKAVEKIEELSDKVGTDLAYYKPPCSVEKLQWASDWNPALAVRYEKMIDQVEGELTKIKGSFSWSDKEDKEDMKHLMEYRKLADADLSNNADMWKQKYEDKLDEIRNRYKADVKDIIIKPEDTIFVDQKVDFEADVDLENKDGVEYKWIIEGIEYDESESADSIKGYVVPLNSGTLSLNFQVLRDGKVIASRKETVEIHPIELDDFYIEKPENAVLSGSTPAIYLRAIAGFSDETETDVSSEALWTVEEGGELVTVDNGKVTLKDKKSFTPEQEYVAISAVYEDMEDMVEIELQIELEDLRAYWETDPKKPEIKADSDPYGIEVTFRAITDDPANDEKRKITWEFQTEDSSYENMEGYEVKRFYSEMGVYGVTITVEDQWGNEDITHDTIAIEAEYVEEEIDSEEEQAEEDEDNPFVTPEGYANIYKGTLDSKTKKLTVGRYDWETPLNKKAGFAEEPSEIWNYNSVGYFNEDSCLKTGLIESGTAHNPGYLIYYSESHNSIGYAVLGTGQKTIISSAFVKEKPNYSHLGFIYQSKGKVRKDSIKITEVLTRGFKIFWLSPEGGECSATITKYAEAGPVIDIVIGKGEELAVPDVEIPEKIKAGDVVRIRINNFNPYYNYTVSVDGKNYKDLETGELTDLGNNFKKGTHKIEVTVKNSDNKKKSWKGEFSIAEIADTSDFDFDLELKDNVLRVILSKWSYDRVYKAFSRDHGSQLSELKSGSEAMSQFVRSDLRGRPKMMEITIDKFIQKDLDTYGFVVKEYDNDGTFIKEVARQIVIPKEKVAVIEEAKGNLTIEYSQEDGPDDGAYEKDYVLFEAVFDGPEPKGRVEYWWYIAGQLYKLTKNKISDSFPRKGSYTVRVVRIDRSTNINQEAEILLKITGPRPEEEESLPKEDANESTEEEVADESKTEEDKDEFVPAVSWGFERKVDGQVVASGGNTTSMANRSQSSPYSGSGVSNSGYYGGSGYRGSNYSYRNSYSSSAKNNSTLSRSTGGSSSGTEKSIYKVEQKKAGVCTPYNIKEYMEEWTKAYKKLFDFLQDKGFNRKLTYLPQLSNTDMTKAYTLYNNHMRMLEKASNCLSQPANRAKINKEFLKDLKPYVSENITKLRNLKKELNKQRNRNPVKSYSGKGTSNFNLQKWRNYWKIQYDNCNNTLIQFEKMASYLNVKPAEETEDAEYEAAKQTIENETRTMLQELEAEYNK